MNFGIYINKYWLSKKNVIDAESGTVKAYNSINTSGKVDYGDDCSIFSEIHITGTDNSEYLNRIFTDCKHIGDITNTTYEGSKILFVNIFTDKNDFFDIVNMLNHTKATDSIYLSFKVPYTFYFNDKYHELCLDNHDRLPIDEFSFTVNSIRS